MLLFLPPFDIDLNISSKRLSEGNTMVDVLSTTNLGSNISDLKRRLSKKTILREKRISLSAAWVGPEGLFPVGKIIPQPPLMELSSLAVGLKAWGAAEL